MRALTIGGYKPNQRVKLTLDGQAQRKEKWKMWSGIISLDNLRSKAAAAQGGIIKVTIEQLNEVMIEIQSSRPTTAPPDRGCRHSHSSYQVDPETLHVWCFSCKPPRQVS